jgi:UDP-N-acetylmuramate dehydrogenase
MTFKGLLRHNESLSHYNTWRVGGIARSLYIPAGLDDLVTFIQSLPADEPVLWLGLGSNSLIGDQGFPGCVIVTQGGLNELTQLEPTLIRVEAGVSCAKMARFAARAGLAGAEFWAGIPGTMGGALRMNAGCYGCETWDSVVSVETLTRSGERRCRTPEEFDIRYRHVGGLASDEWFIAATCRLVPGDKDKALAEIKDLLARRAATQPTSEYNCGSVFRNPPGDYAARLIESCGLKGKEMGGAKVSEKHANFITNATGTATAQDIEQLIQHVHATVLANTGVNLVREVHFIGE